GVALLWVLTAGGAGAGQQPGGGPGAAGQRLPEEAQADREEGKKNQPYKPEGEKGKEEGKEKKEEWYSVFGQATVVPQGNWKFRSPYVGPNSLLPLLSYRTTATATLYLDTRLWPGAELIFNPEMAGGRGLSNTLGLAG